MVTFFNDKTKRKRLYFDLETSPNIGFFWEAGFRLKIPYENIIKERAIICICWKWERQKRIHSLTWDRRQGDKKMLRQFIEVLNKADEIIAHNGDRFDIVWLRTRCIKHGIPMMPDYTSIDTLKEARNKFNFNSNRLDYISTYLGVGGKISTGGFNLWRNIVLKKSPAALTKMVRYCKNDVVILERVFQKMNQFLPAKTRLQGIRECPECGSVRVEIQRIKKLASGIKKICLRCKNCGKYHTMPLSKFLKL